MKKAYLYQFFTGGEVVESVGSFDLDQILSKVNETETEYCKAAGVDEDIWVRETKNESNDVIYYSYDGDIRNESTGEEIEILVKEIDFLD